MVQHKRKSTHTYEYKGQTSTIYEFSIKYNLSYSILRKRVYRGWSIAEAIETPFARHKMKIDINKNPKISKNCYKGDVILSLDRLIKLSDEKESVYHDVWGIKPAKVLIMMQMFLIDKSIKNKRLFEVLNSKNYEILVK